MNLDDPRETRKRLYGRARAWIREARKLRRKGATAEQIMQCISTVKSIRANIKSKFGRRAE